MTRKLKIALTLLIIAFNISAKNLVVVLDAGHGGHDPGAVGATSSEKTITLAVALKTGEQLKQILGKNVNVIYTRDSDFFVPLGNRAQIANNAKADLFVSIHANSISDLKRRTLVQGASVYVRGFASSKQASEVAAFENASLKYEKTTSSAEQSLLDDLMWNRNLEQSISLADLMLESMAKNASRKRGAVEQNDFAVLRLSKMPAVLVELDYICNPAMEKFLISTQGQQQLAYSLASAIAAYHTGKPVSATETKQNQKKKEKENQQNTIKEDDKKPTGSTTPESDKEIFKIQFLIAGKPLPDNSPKLKGLTNADYYIDGNSLKYTVGSFTTIEEANKQLPAIKKLFPDAFVIKFKNGKRIK